MKFLVKLLLKAGVALGVLFIGYTYFLPGMMSGGMQLPGMSDKSAKGLGDVSNLTVKEDVTVYKWTDAQGVTHFGGVPPTGQGQYEKKEILADTNVVQSLKNAEEEEEETKARSKVARVGSAYTPEGVKDILDSAKDIQEQMKDRASEQQKIMDNL